MKRPPSGPAGTPAGAQSAPPPETPRLSDARSGNVDPIGTSEAVVPPARAAVRLQVRVAPKIYEWVHRAAILRRSNAGEIVERAIHRLARSEAAFWPEEDLPRLGRYRRR